jgi:YesN/AraC family two-component response regulator
VEALKAFRADPARYDLVLTDMIMPNMTGFELTQELTLIKPGVPVVLCTGFSEGMTSDKVAEMGIRGVLMKPVLRSEMARMLRKILSEEKSPTQEP